MLHRVYGSFRGASIKNFLKLLSLFIKTFFSKRQIRRLVYLMQCSSLADG